MDRKWYGQHQRDNRVWLKRLMKHFDLTRPQVAQACSVTLSTVDRWLVPDDKPSHRTMPNIARKLLTLMAEKGDFDKESG